MTEPLRLGIAGLGTVGVGVVKIVRQQAALLELRTGRKIEISAVSARTKGRDRGVSLSGYAWEDDPVALATRDDVDVFVEVGEYGEVGKCYKVNEIHSTTGRRGQQCQRDRKG